MTQTTHLKEKLRPKTQSKHDNSGKPRDEEVSFGRKQNRSRLGLAQRARKARQGQGKKLQESESREWTTSSLPSLDDSMDAKEWLNAKRQQVSLQQPHGSQGVMPLNLSPLP